MISFFDLWERMDSATPLMDSGEDTKALQVIRAGNSLHKKDDRSFWEEFMELCANSQGMADLLNINSSIVTNWTSKIQELLKQVDNIDQTHSLNRVIKLEKLCTHHQKEMLVIAQKIDYLKQHSWE